MIENEAVSYGNMEFNQFLMGLNREESLVYRRPLDVVCNHVEWYKPRKIFKI